MALGVYLTSRDRPLAHVLRDAQEAWEQFEAALTALPEEALMASDPFPWMERRTLGTGLLHDFVTHMHEEHLPLIRAWLDRSAEP